MTTQPIDADGPLVPMPALTREALREAVRHIKPLNLTQFDRELGEAFDQSVQTGSIGWMRGFLIKWATSSRLSAGPRVLHHSGKPSESLKTPRRMMTASTVLNGKSPVSSVRLNERRGCDRWADAHDSMSDELRSRRVLPWTTPDGKPCYLSTDGHGPVSALADQIEARQLATGEAVLRHARLMPADPKIPPGEFRFLSARLAEALQDTLRVARSRAGG